MSEVQRLLIEEDGETYEIYVESKEIPLMPTPSLKFPRTHVLLGKQELALLWTEQAS